MSKINRHYLEIHLAVLLFGGAGIFGKLILISAGGIVLGRAAFAAIFIFCMTKSLRAYRSNSIITDKQISSQTMDCEQESVSFIENEFSPKAPKDLAIFCLLGCILAFHWVAFFQSIQLSSVAIGVLTFSTFPIFTTFLEPFVSKETFNISDLFLALIAFVGVAFVMPSMEFQNEDTQGALWGIGAGASFAVLALISKRMVSGYTSNAVSFYQNGIAALILLPFFGGDVLGGSPQDWVYLLVLGIVFTGIAHTLFISSMQGMKAQTASLITSLEPVYGILLAWLLLNEIPSFRMLVGGGLILGVAFYATVRK